jgi:putative phosphoribosyl transferase
MVRRLAAYRVPRLSDCAPGRTVVIVDDGLVSGLSMQVAIACARRHGARGTVVAVPCASDRALYEVGSLLCGTRDRLVCPRGDPCLLSEGDYYRDLHEVSDEDVTRILENAAANGPVFDCSSSRVF